MSFAVLIRLTCDTPGCVAQSRNLKSALVDLRFDLPRARRVAADGGWTKQKMAGKKAGSMDFCPKCSAERKSTRKEPPL